MKINKIDRNNLKFDRLHKKAIDNFTKITTQIYKSEYWKLRKNIESLRNQLDQMYHTYLNLLMTGEIEVNDINEKIEIETATEGEKDGKQ